MRELPRVVPSRDRRPWGDGVRWLPVARPDLRSLAHPDASCLVSVRANKINYVSREPGAVQFHEGAGDREWS